MHRYMRKTAFMLPILLSACASIPNGPSSMALPGSGKNFDQFRADDASCRQFALDQIGGKTASQASDDSFARSAALGTVLGTAVGAVAGGGKGAGIGAATGLVLGSAIGADESRISSHESQHRYDNAYIQCMYASGHRVPVSGTVMEQRPAPYSQPQAPIAPPASSPAAYPPPPPGYMPPIPSEPPK